MNDEQEDFWVDWSMHIGEVKMFHDHLCYAIESWPGSPRRPVEEQEFLKFMRVKDICDAHGVPNGKTLIRK